MCGKPSEVIFSCVSLRGASRKPLLSPRTVKIDRFRRCFYEALLIPHFHVWMGLGCPTSPQMTTKEPEVPVSLLGTSRKPLLLPKMVKIDQICNNTISLDGRCTSFSFVNRYRMSKTSTKKAWSASFAAWAFPKTVSFTKMVKIDQFCHNTISRCSTSPSNAVYLIYKWLQDV